MKKSILLGCVVLAGLFSSVVSANRLTAGGNIDVVVPLPPEVWNNAGTRGTNNNNCSRCCIYQNQNYSEGAIVRVEGEILQCVRDPNVVGTNPLIWKRLTR
ncbi:YnjH family protein [Yersinia ruckeri]|uniref:YnjH family protein n=1 Tax=Yersinia ruckeri TaxID=29486 RepID=UPI00223733A7|nr:YnjH family protein [Yersinia ruckeri]MCW6638538.1 YnjH family protein [Yersinia ruckeri]UZX66658.1 YnjH family protein [Yersinia ruckeri]